MIRSFSLIHFVLLLLGCLHVGCTDHDPVTDRPQPAELPQVTTGNMAVLNPDQFLFSVNLANVQPDAVQEFGIVYSVHGYNVLTSKTTEPNIDWSKIRFTDAPSNALHTKDVVALATSYFRIYYRAYAVISNGSVVYGEVKYHQQDRSGRAILEAVGNPKLSKPYHAGVVLLDLGQKPIKNFGVVYAYNTASNQSINALPTLADKSIKFSYQKVKIPVGGAGTGFLLDNLKLDAVNEIYLRSFVEYTDGTVDYGRHVGHAKQ